MIKKYLIAGLIALLPIALTLMVISWLFNFFTAPFMGIAKSLVYLFENWTKIDIERHASLVLFISRVLTLILLLALTFLLGFLGRRLFFKPLADRVHNFLMRIPFVKSVYRVSKEVTGAVFSQNEKALKKTVLIPFPHADAHTIAFLTGDAPSAATHACKEVDVSVLVSTAPHPLTGFLLLTSKKNLIETNVSVEDAFKFLVSCGTLQLDDKKS